MGCWNETCGITQLPIGYGDKVRVFVIASQGAYSFHKDGEGGGGTCASTDRWAPIGPAIQGRYDDYGGVEKIVYDDNAKMVEKRLCDGWVQPAKEYEWDEVPELDKMKLKNFLHFIERDRGKFKEIKTKHLGLMFVLEDVYQAMANFDRIEAHHIPGDFEYKPFTHALQLDLKDWYDSTVDLYEISFKDASYYDLIAELSDLRFFSRYREDGTKVFKEPLIELAKKKLPFEHKRVQALVCRLLELTNFSVSMDRARKQWMPQSGKGSQDYEMDIYQAINTATNKIIEARSKEMLEDGAETKDENGYLPYMIEHNLEVQRKRDQDEDKQVPAKKIR